MHVEADTAASALATTWEHLIAGVSGGWIRREAGLFAAVTGVAVPTLNGVWAESVDPDERLVGDLLDQVAATGLPYCLELRPEGSEHAARHAIDRGLVPGEKIPLMVLENADRLEAAQQVEGLAIRQLAPEEAALHATIAARGFEAPEEPFVQLMTPEALSRPGVRCYVGETDDNVVTTGFGVTLGPFVGIFNIATPSEWRGRGFGAAVTARAAADGLEAGARWSYLQSSKAGYEVYVRLGYATLEVWDCWVTVS
jgi:hypothetical protein